MSIQNSSSTKIKIQEGPVHIPFLFSPMHFMYLFNEKHLSYPDAITVPTLYTYSLIWHFNTKTLAFLLVAAQYTCYISAPRYGWPKISCTSQHVLFGNFTNIVVCTTNSAYDVGIHNNQFHTGHFSNSLNTLQYTVLNKTTC